MTKSSSLASLQILEGYYEISMQPSLLQAEQLQLSQLVLAPVLNPYSGLSLSAWTRGQDQRTGSFSLPLIYLSSFVTYEL